MFCIHDWEKIGIPRYLKDNKSENVEMTVKCLCRKCGKEDDVTFYMPKVNEKRE